MAELGAVLLPLLVLGAPALGVLLLVLPWIFGASLSERAVAAIARVCNGAALLGVLILVVARLLDLAPGTLPIGVWWVEQGRAVSLELLLDGPGLASALLGAAVTVAAGELSITYLHRERGFLRFFATLCLTQLSVVLVSLGGSTLMAFAGWEGLGLGSYLLIGYYYDRQDTSRFATRAFVINRIGDAAFMLGALLCALWLGDTGWRVVAARAGVLSDLQALALASCFGLAAAVKAGQLPFSFWLSRAMEGPTPSSALFYGTIATHAGVLLLLRAAPILHVGQLAGALIVVIGAASAIYGTSVSSAQTDIKSSLAYGAIGQLGVMFVWVGLGFDTLALVHLVAHGAVRGVQLFHAPSVVHDPPVQAVGDMFQRSAYATAAALNRGWLEELALGTVAEPLRTLSRDLDRLDTVLISRATGSPARRAIQGLAGWREQGVNPSEVGVGRGVVGRLTQWTAAALARIEDQLVLRAIGQGLPEAGGKLGVLLNRVELSLGRLWVIALIVLATLLAVS